jgi:hypothetical protein
MTRGTSLVHGVSLSLRGSGRLDTRLDTPPISFRHPRVSRIARSNSTRIHGTHVLVEEPSTASTLEI